MLTGISKVTLDVPRDRASTFDPKLIAKYLRRFLDFDGKIISMYARGITALRGTSRSCTASKCSPDLIATITATILDTVAQWQNQPLDAC